MQSSGVGREGMGRVEKKMNVQQGATNVKRKSKIKKNKKRKKRKKKKKIGERGGLRTTSPSLFFCPSL